MDDFFGISLSELLLVGAIAVIVFGKDLPSALRKAGKAVGSLKKLFDSFDQEFRQNIDDIGLNVSLPKLGLKPDYSSGPPTRQKNDANRYSLGTDYLEPTAPKFEPPPERP